jgi:hypothetical protein
VSPPQKTELKRPVMLSIWAANKTNKTTTNQVRTVARGAGLRAAGCGGQRDAGDLASGRGLARAILPLCTVMGYPSRGSPCKRDRVDEEMGQLTVPPSSIPGAAGPDAEALAGWRAGMRAMAALPHVTCAPPRAYPMWAAQVARWRLSMCSMDIPLGVVLILKYNVLRAVCHSILSMHRPRPQTQPRGAGHSWTS